VVRCQLGPYVNICNLVEVPTFGNCVLLFIFLLFFIFFIFFCLRVHPYKQLCASVQVKGGFSGFWDRPEPESFGEVLSRCLRRILRPQKIKENKTDHGLRQRRQTTI
jgi:hypothetical protein